MKPRIMKTEEARKNRLDAIEKAEELTEIFASHEEETWIKANYASYMICRDIPALVGHHIYYFDYKSIGKIIDLELVYYKNGNIRCGYLRGEKITKKEVAAIQDKCRIRYDGTTGEWFCAKGQPDPEIMAAIRATMAIGESPDTDGGLDAEDPATRVEIVVKVPGHADLACLYEVMDIAEVKASHLPAENFRHNPAYKYENERRYNAGGRDMEKVVEIAGDLDPAYVVAESPTALEGTPVVDSGKNVLGGNGRTMAIAWAYAKIPARAEAYRQAVKAFCQKRGIAFPNEGKPVLVRKIIDPISRNEGQALISLLNAPSGDARESRADAYSRGTRFSPKTLTAIANALSASDSLRSYFDDQDSLPLVDMIIADGVIMDNERNRYLNDGYMNPEGKALVEASLRSIVMPDLETLATMPAPIIAKIDAAIPHLLIASKVHEKWNILPSFRDALSLYGEWKNQDQTYDLFLSQGNFFQKPAMERYDQGSIEICRALIDLKKTEFVNKFKGFAGQAKISIEAGGLGVGMPVDQAYQKYLGYDMPRKKDQAKEETTTSRDRGYIASPGALLPAVYTDEIYFQLITIELLKLGYYTPIQHRIGLRLFVGFSHLYIDIYPHMISAKSWQYFPFAELSVYKGKFIGYAEEYDIEYSAYRKYNDPYMMALWIQYQFMKWALKIGSTAMKSASLTRDTYEEQVNYLKRATDVKKSNHIIIPIMRDSKYKLRAYIAHKQGTMPLIGETPEKPESPKTRKPKEIKNDCTPHNSLRVLGTQTLDMNPLLVQCRDYFGCDISVTARSKKCYEVDGHPGFRIIRNGRSWQLRLLHTYVEEASENPENDIDIMDAQDA